MVKKHRAEERRRGTNQHHALDGNVDYAGALRHQPRHGAVSNRRGFHQSQKDETRKKDNIHDYSPPPPPPLPPQVSLKWILPSATGPLALMRYKPRMI